MLFKNCLLLFLMELMVMAEHNFSPTSNWEAIIEKNLMKLDSRRRQTSSEQTVEQALSKSWLAKKAKMSPPSLMCWNCHAENMEQCIEKGELSLCPNENDSCGLEERRWAGILVGLELGCKAHEDCVDDINKNFILETNQCQPTEMGHSICRQCCGTDLCNRGWKIRSESGWQYDYLL